MESGIIFQLCEVIKGFVVLSEPEGNNTGIFSCFNKDSIILENGFKLFECIFQPALVVKPRAILQAVFLITYRYRQRLKMLSDIFICQS